MGKRFVSERYRPELGEKRMVSSSTAPLAGSCLTATAAIGRVGRVHQSPADLDTAPGIGFFPLAHAEATQEHCRVPSTQSSPKDQLEHFLDKYEAVIAARARACIAGLRRRLPTATEVVYDNYNALVIGFGPSERASEAIFSIAVYPRWVTLFFLQGANLPDPEGLLRGHGAKVRHIVLNDAKELKTPPVEALISAGLAAAKKALDPKAKRSLVIKSVSLKQRPRRPTR